MSKSEKLFFCQLLYTIRQLENFGFTDKSHFCFFQLYLLHIFKHSSDERWKVELIPSLLGQEFCESISLAFHDVAHVALTKGVELELHVSIRLRCWKTRVRVSIIVHLFKNALLPRQRFWVKATIAHQPFQFLLINFLQMHLKKSIAVRTAGQNKQYVTSDLHENKLCALLVRRPWKICSDVAELGEIRASSAQGWRRSHTVPGHR